jgi:hypothetical protein
MEIQPDPFVIAEDPLDFPDASFDAKVFSPAPPAGRKKVKEEAQRLSACGMTLPVSWTPEEARLCFGKPPALS